MVASGVIVVMGRAVTGSGAERNENSTCLWHQLKGFVNAVQGLSKINMHDTHQWLQFCGQHLAHIISHHIFPRVLTRVHVLR